MVLSLIKQRDSKKTEGSHLQAHSPKKSSTSGAGSGPQEQNPVSNVGHSIPAAWATPLPPGKFALAGIWNK